MMKITRLGTPAFLATRYRNLGRNWARRRNDNPKAEFYWPNVEGVRLNLRLLSSLKAQTQSHCSFCDGFPIETVSAETVEHFRPKGKFPRLAYCWINLFYCCSKCQEAKQESFDVLLLKPDKLDYFFEQFFLYDYSNGEILPNPDLLKVNPTNFAAAKVTIETYGLNRFGRPAARQRNIKVFRSMNNPVLDDFPYRFTLMTL